jgi:hypothetical protein
MLQIERHYNKYKVKFVGTRTSQLCADIEEVQAVTAHYFGKSCGDVCPVCRQRPGRKKGD